MEIKFKVWDKQKNEFCKDWILLFIGYCETTIDDKERFIFLELTGFKDMHGKDIYDQDILRYTYMSKGRQKEVIEVMERYATEDFNGFMLHKGWKCEVIGNKLKNPELVK